MELPGHIKDFSANDHIQTFGINVPKIKYVKDTTSVRKEQLEVIEHFLESYILTDGEQCSNAGEESFNSNSDSNVKDPDTSTLRKKLLSEFKYHASAALAHANALSNYLGEEGYSSYIEVIYNVCSFMEQFAHLNEQIIPVKISYLIDELIVLGRSLAAAVVAAQGCFQLENEHIEFAGALTQKLNCIDFDTEYNSLYADNIESIISSKEMALKRLYKKISENVQEASECREQLNNTYHKIGKSLYSAGFYFQEYSDAYDVVDSSEVNNLAIEDNSANEGCEKSGGNNSNTAGKSNYGKSEETFGDILKLARSLVKTCNNKEMIKSYL